MTMAWTGSGPHRPRARFVFAVFVIATVAVGLNMRGPIVGIPPLLPRIAEDLGLQNSALSLLTSIPLACFALLSPAMGALAGRIGPQRTITLAVGLLAAAIAARPWFGFAGLLVGSVAVGVAIAACNVLVPVVVRLNAAARAGLVMSVSTASYGVGSSVSAWFATPLADQLGWRAALALLAIPAFGALLASIAQIAIGREDRPVVAEVAAVAAARGSFRSWRDSATLTIALFFGLQCVLFFGLSTWLPTLLIDRHAAVAAEGGTALFIFQAVGVLGMLSVSPLRRILGSHRGVGFVTTFGWIAMFLGLAFAPQWWVLWSVFGGFAQGLGVSLALVLVAVRPARPELVRGTSVTVLSIGYGLAVLGPLGLAAIADFTGEWSVSLWACVVVAVLMIAVSWIAASPHPIGPELQRADGAKLVLR